jgi:hypothetical protein
MSDRREDNSPAATEETSAPRGNTASQSAEGEATKGSSRTEPGKNNSKTDCTKKQCKPKKKRTKKSIKPEETSDDENENETQKSDEESEDDGLSDLESQSECDTKKKRSTKKKPEPQKSKKKAKSKNAKKQLKSRKPASDSDEESAISDDLDDSEAEETQQQQQDLSQQIQLLQLQQLQLQQMQTMQTMHGIPQSGMHQGFNTYQLGGGAALAGGLAQLGLDGSRALIPPPGGDRLRRRPGNARDRLRLASGLDSSISLDGSTQKSNQKRNSKANPKLDYKRVDQVWDNTIHNYKLQDTAEGSLDAQFDDYVFHVRRAFDWEGKYKQTIVDIKSKLLREALQDVMGNIKGVSLVEEVPKLDPNMLFLYVFRACCCSALRSDQIS